MLAHRVGVVVRGIVVEKFDVTDQRRAREDRFKKIVTQQRLIGHAIVERPLEGIHVVETFAGIDAFAEKILIQRRKRRSCMDRFRCCLRRCGQTTSGMRSRAKCLRAAVESRNPLRLAQPRNRSAAD